MRTHLIHELGKRWEWEEFCEESGQIVKITAKRMPVTNEFRLRRVYQNGLIVTDTKASFYDAEKQLLWQKAHSHHAKCEIYEVRRVGSWVFFVWIEDGEMRNRLLTDPDDVVIFNAGIEHLVLPGSRAHFRTYINPAESVRKPVGNPDRKGNDWWPSKDYRLCCIPKSITTFASLLQHFDGAEAMLPFMRST